MINPIAQMDRKEKLSSILLKISASDEQRGKQHIPHCSFGQGVCSPPGTASTPPLSTGYYTGRQQVEPGDLRSLHP